MGKRMSYTEEFKLGAVAGYRQRSQRYIGCWSARVCTKSLYDWGKRYDSSPDTPAGSADTAEIKRLSPQIAPAMLCRLSPVWTR